MKRILIAVLASILCVWGIWQAARIGFARTLDEYAAEGRRDNVAAVVATLAGLSDSKTAADRAVTLLPADAESHAARAEVLQRVEDYQQARDEFQRAVQMRPRDYYLWMLLGVARDETADQAGALRALQQSVALAPAYAQPHWQLGNLLLRLSQLDQAFVELRQAAQANPSLWPNVADLAWGVYGHDADAVVRTIRPETDTARMALALFFAREKQGAAAVDQFRAIRVKPDKTTESLLDTLLGSKQFPEAYEVWASLRGVPVTKGALTDAATIRDGGFEDVLTVGQTGFGWQITPDVVNVTMSIDEGAHQAGSRSLRVDFRGNSNPVAPLFTQMVLVQPRTRYHLGLAALSKDFVSAADPMITLIDASDSNKVVLAQSPPLRSDPNVWREFAIDFTTNVDTQAIVIKFARQACASDPCPAFGTVWLDSVSMERR
ncbi:MAG: Tetratricopeptide repeat [Blastocatellia bacterium]|jgi:tetratricopeptide (TPR) repeat protein|nr:Tetratricopeptide repeat [Blastocatellia bacterium]